jgi:hypothetical protein
MPNSIRDGKGRGYLAGVTEENRLLTNASTVSQRTHVSSKHGQAFTWSTNLQTLSAGDTWHWVLWWKVTSTDKNLHIVEIEASWNGGSTNYDKPLQMKNVITAAGAPTANHTLFAPSNNNKLSSNVAELTVYKWDGVAAGMTNSAGGSGGDTFHQPGYSTKQFSGAVITGLNEAVGLMVKAPEVGDFNIGVAGYFTEKGAEI